MTLDDLLTLDRRGLSRAFDAGQPLPPGALVPGVYDGVSLGQPRWIGWLTWKKFQKVVLPDGRGHNRSVVQDALDAPWTPATRGGRERTYGAFRVGSGPTGPVIDYGPAFDPLVDTGGGWWLGVTVLGARGRGLRTPTWFALRPPISG